MILRDEIPYGANGLHYLSRAITLHSLISSVGHTRLTGETYDFNGMKRENEEFVVFQYTLKGEGRLEYEGEKYALKEGTAMMVHIPHNHRYFYPPQSSLWEFVYICFYGSELLRICRLVESTLGPVMELSENHKHIQLSLDIIKSAMSEKGEPHVLRYSQMAYQWGMSLAGLMEDKKGREESHLIRKTRQFCRENLHRAIGVDDMAQAAGCSRSHLSRVFSHSTQMGLQEYLEYLRMQKATRLLYNKALTVKEVAHRCGYGDENYFCKVFRRNFSHSPGRYREIGL